MATKTWIGSVGNTDYFNNVNWSPAGAPASNGSDDALVTGTTNYTITITADTSGQTFSAGALTLNDPNMILSIGSFAFNVDTSTTFTAGTVSIAGGQFSLGSGTSTFGAGATLVGNGVVFGTFTGNGTLEAAGPAESTLELADIISSGSLNLVVDGGDFMQFDAAVGAGNTVTFNAASGGILLLDTAGFEATISGFVAAANTGTGPANFIDIVDHTGFSGSYDFASNQITLSGGDITSPLTIKLSGSYDPGSIVQTRSSAFAGTDIWLTVCFAEGTRILTDKGEVAVEDLVPGDMALTADQEALPIRWIGHRRIDLAAHPRPAFAAPVRIRRGAWGENQPHRDLLLSPDHCLLADDKLIPAKLLINGMTIVQERDVRAVTYYHVELPRHAVLIAEGLPAESYLDTGNRAFFSNAGLALILHPEFHVNAGLNAWEHDACAPLAVSEAAVRPVWQALAGRAQSLGFVPPAIVTTDDADLALIANGRSFRPISAHANRFVFVLPAGVGSVRITSRSAAPAEIKPWLEDHRQLGVAISRIVFRGPNDHVELPVDHPALAAGWHAVEAEAHAMWRWTDGNALVPIDAIDGPVTVELHVRQLATYVVATHDPVQTLAA